MMNDVLWGMERKEITAVIILDMSAAFDTVPQPASDYPLKQIWYNRYCTTMAPELPETLRNESLH